MGWARGKDAIMPILLSMRHARQHLFRMLQQSFLLPRVKEETTAAPAAAHDTTHDIDLSLRPRNLRAVHVLCDSRTHSQHNL